METVIVKILDKDYQVACPADEKDDLLSAANYLDSKMRDIKSGGKVIGLERIAVMAALNISHELLNSERDSEPLQEVEHQASVLQDKIDRALHNLRQLDL